MSKTVVAPIIAVVCMAAQLIFGVKIDDATQSQIADAIINIVLVGATVYGIFKNHKTQ